MSYKHLSLVSLVFLVPLVQISNRIAIDGIRDFEQMPTLATRYAKDIAPGDGVLSSETVGKRKLSEPDASSQ